MSDDSVCGHFFFFKQKTAYEMRISDWSSDVCSSDLSGGLACREPLDREPFEQAAKHVGADSPCRHVELEFPRDDLRDQAHRLQTLDPAIVEADEFDQPVVHRANALEPMPLPTMQHGIALERSDKSRVGQECVNKCKSRG